jgi:hypothetical protein
MKISRVDLDLQMLEGEWDIVLSNYTFWHGKKEAKVTYKILSNNILEDTLSFRKPGGATKCIRGFDYQDEVLPNFFLWKGAGLLGFIKTPWCFFQIGNQNDWAISYFWKPIFGKMPGLDVYFRNRNSFDANGEFVLNYIRNEPRLNRICSNLFQIENANYNNFIKNEV